MKTKHDTIIWDNGDDLGPNAISSQRDTFYPFLSQTADDFKLGEQKLISGVYWWGNFWSGIVDPCDFEIIFYADNGSGNSPTGGGMDDPTSTALAVYNIQGISGYPLSQNGYFQYHAELDQKFIANPNKKYWISIVAEVTFPPQWGWIINGQNPDFLSPSVQGFPFAGISFWTSHGYGDMAFYLTGNNIEPLKANPNGPYYAITREQVQLNGTAKGGINPYKFYWDFGDGNFSYIQNPTHIYTDVGNYTAVLNVTDISDNSASNTTWVWVQEKNTAPDTPIIEGPANGKKRISYNFTFKSEDPDRTDIWYVVEWGDNNNSGWLGPYGSGIEVTMSHKWNRGGTYTIRCKAKDPYDDESDLAELKITIPRNRETTFLLYKWFLERIIILYKMFS